jgi:hypothetical protein
MSNNNEAKQFKRLNFFTGFFTTADDWKEGQAYHLEKRKFLNRGLHTPGVIHLKPYGEQSLAVTAINSSGDPAATNNDALSVQVAPGAALDRSGNLIYLDIKRELDLKELAKDQDPPVALTTPEIYLAIGYEEFCSDYSANVQDPDYSGFRRVTEQPKFAVLTAEPDEGEWLALARIRIGTGSGPITNDAIDTSVVLKAGVMDPNRDAQKEAVHARIVDAHSYHLQKEQRHNRGIHTPGILRGVGDCFKVVAAGGNTIRVEPGAALDGDGNEIYLATALCKEVDLSKAPCRIYVAVKYHDDFADYLDDFDSSFDGVFTTAEIVLMPIAPDNKTAIKIAYIDLREGMKEIQQSDIQISDLAWAGSVVVKEAGLPEALREQIRLGMVTTRENMAELALRFPSPAVNDVRAAALGIQLALDTLRYEQIAVRLHTLADVEQDVHQELGEHYPPLVWQSAFKQYGLAVDALLEAVLHHEPPETLLNLQQQVAIMAYDLAQVILQPPTADAGRDQFIETVEPTVDVTLDASGSQAAQGHQLVLYRWENLTTRTVLTKTDQPQCTVNLPVGVHVLRLVVEDDAHLRSEPDIVVITVELSEITISHIEPSAGWRGATLTAVISGANLHHATAVKAYLRDQEDERVRVTLQSGGDKEHLPVSIRISKLAALGERVLEVVTPLGTATVSFTVVPHEAPTILAIEPVWGMPGSIHPLPARIAGDHFDQANAVTFLYGAKPDPNIRTVIRQATPDYLGVDLTISANAEFGRRRFTVTTPAGTTESPPTVVFSVMPGFLQVAIMLLTLITAIVHLTLYFPNALFILNGLGYLALLAGLYMPTRWLFVGLRSWMRWALLVYALLTIISWLPIGDRTTLAYLTKAIEVLLVGLLLIESRQP